MKFSFFFTFFLFSFLIGNGQVPVPPQGGQVPVPPQGGQVPVPPQSLFGNIPNPNDLLERVRLRDHDANMILDMIQRITERYILRPQNLPQVKITFDSIDVLSKGDTLLALQSLLAMNGIGITEIDSQFYKAVPASGMNVHVPIWLDVPASSLPPSQDIYFKVFYLEYIPADKMREILNPFATPNVSSLLTLPSQKSIMITDSLINLQRMEKLIQRVDQPQPEKDIITFWYETKRFNARTIAAYFDSQWEELWKDKFSIRPQFFNLLDKESKQKEKIIEKIPKKGNDNDENKVVDYKELEVDIFPYKMLGITCHINDKIMLTGILEEFDVSVAEDSNFVIGWFKPKRFISSAVAQFFDSAWEKLLKDEFHHKPIFMFEGTSIQLGYYCHKEDEEKLLQYLESLDVELPYEINSKLIPLYHASSSAVAQTLQMMALRVVEGGRSNSEAGKPGGQSNVNSARQSLQSWQDPFFSEIFYFFQDTRSNGIFVMGTLEDVIRAEEYIKTLDTPLPMAKIDTIFVMVDLSQSNQRGIDALFQDVSWQKGGIVQETVTDAGADNIPGTADDTQTVVTSGVEDQVAGTLKVPLLNSALSFEMDSWKVNQIQWNQIFSLASQREDIRIFSTPSITISHGKDEGPVVTSEGSAETSGGGTEGAQGKGQFSEIEIIDERSIGLPGVTMANGQTSQPNIQKLVAKTSLTVLHPRIRKTVRDSTGRVIERGTVFMSVIVTAQKFDTTVSNTYEGQTLPAIKGRSAVTDLAIRDGQIMALGGFQEVQMDEEVSKYNFLSNIPYLGEKFFTPTQRRYTPTEMMIFIRPTIIDPLNPMDDLSSFNSDRIDSMMNREYTPAFRSPSGKIFGAPDKKKSYSEQDEPSEKPSL
ncbi:MAG: secretin N-terminal domain-containing protein [Opitutae bacterium]